MRWNPVTLIRVIGLFLCGSSVLITLLHPTTGPASQTTTLLGALMPWLGLSATQTFCIMTPLLVAGMLWWCTENRARVALSNHIISLLALQTLLALLVAPELQFVVAVQAGLLLPARWGAIWVTAQALFSWMGAMLFPHLMEWAIPADADLLHRSLGIGLFMLIAMLYNLFAYALGWFAATEQRQSRALDLTNRSLERTNEELSAAQKAVSATARLQERLSIARELHDAVGHQLTALSVSLQIVSRLSKDDAREPVLEAYGMTAKLLKDVREVVSSMREPVSVDFVRDVNAFVLRIERPTVHLKLAQLNLAQLPVTLEGRIAHCLLRCAQEIVTNTVRHADAANLWIQGAIRQNNYELYAHDDGKGSPAIERGNGLAGMEEGIRELHGELLVSSAPERGFQVSIRIPLRAGAQ